MINVKLITKIFKVLCLIGLILLLMNSCNDSSNPLTNEEPCCVNPPDLDLRSEEQDDTDLKGELACAGGVCEIV